MCLITAAPKKSLIDPDTLEDAFDNNSDGFGIMYAEGGKLFVCKRLSNFQTFKKLFEVVPDDVPLAIHFRFATHGARNVENIHPFCVLDSSNGDPVDLAIMHNGVISGMGGYSTGYWERGTWHKGTEDTRSDTNIYIDDYLRPIIKESPGLVANESFRKLVERDIGGGNKLLFLRGDGEMFIFNKKSGHESKDFPDVWFSNYYSFNKNHRNNKNRWAPPVQNVYTPPATVINEPPKTRGNGELKFETDLPANIQAILDGIGKDKSYNLKLLSPKQDGFYNGYGWIKEQNLMYQGGRELASLHLNWVTERDKPKEEPPSSNESKVYDLTIAQQALAHELESNFGPEDLRKITQAEIMQWVLDHPLQAAKYLQVHLKTYGGITAIHNFVQQNLDSCSEAIFEHSHNGKLIELKAPNIFNVPNSLDSDDLDIMMYGM